MAIGKGAFDLTGYPISRRPRPSGRFLVSERRHLSADQKERARFVLSSARTLLNRPNGLAHAFGGMSGYPTISARLGSAPVVPTAASGAS